MDVSVVISQQCCDSRIVCWQDGIVPYIISVRYPLERPKGNWNRLQPLEQPARLSAAVERPKGYFVLFVGRRYYLRPNPLRSPPLRPLERPLANGTREALLERPLANGTREALLEQPPGLERPPGLWNSLQLFERPQG